MDKITFKPIGYILSEYEDISQVPKSSTESFDNTAEMIINPEFLEAMSDIKTGEEYMVIFVFDKSEGYKQKVRIRGTGPITGLFSTHAPNRPNPIGVSTIRIKEIKNNKIIFNGVDMLNHTPVLDLKKIFK